MNAKGLKPVSAQSTQTTTAPSTPAKLATHSERVERFDVGNGGPALPPSELLEFSDSTFTDTPTNITQGTDVSLYKALHSYAKQLWQSTTTSVITIAAGARERRAAWLAQKAVKKRARQLQKLRSMLLVFSPELQTSALQEPVQEPLITAKTRGSKDSELSHASEINARVPDDQSGHQLDINVEPVSYTHLT